MKTEKNSDKKNASRPGPGTAGTYVKENFVSLISFLVMFVLVSLLAFFRIATTNTISSYNLNDYEVGQVSDITIRANKSLPADYDNPVSVQKGEKVIRKGFPITEEGYAKLKRMAESSAYIDYRAFADSVIFLIMLGVLHFFLFSTTCLGRKPSGKEMITENAFFLFTYAVAVLGMKTVIFSSPYALGVILPVAFCAFLMAILFGQLDALYFALHAAFGVLNASGYQLVPFLYTLCISLSAARIVHKIERRIDIVFASLLQAVLSAVFLFVFKIIFSDNFGDGLLSLTGVAFNGFLSGILCLGFLTPLEYVLNSASVFRLMDLSDLNNPIMKKMLVTASGTYNHSVMVASLAEAACREIGANSLIARVGGFFHDIGKMDNPEYFVENQSGRENIHKDMTPSLSVSIIRSHVKKGLEKAREMRMPPQIVDIISEHHGNQVIKYFFNEAKQADPNANPEDFSYSGNPPTTRESAVVMLADTVEAACRTLEKPSVPRLEKFIQMLINSKIEEHQLDNCSLTFKDLAIIRKAFVQMLAGYYHSRIEYPDQKDPDSAKPQEAVLGDRTLNRVRGVEPSAGEDEDDEEEAADSSASAGSSAAAAGGDDAAAKQKAGAKVKKEVKAEKGKSNGK
ncbi:MAG: HDIG domain-containing protein [Treponema sp.]|jgi:hypothetical protein|nr:HDIG domain-containing protein [Treponema sp.]